MAVLFHKKYLEPALWALALLLLFFWNPSEGERSLCLFRFAGFQSCPGCGIGHAMHHALHLRFAESLQHHVAGIPATVLLVYKILASIKQHKTTPHESQSVPHDVTGVTAR